MIRRYINLAFFYAIAAMVCGVFYREFTKFSGFDGQTNLSVMHTHYFMLGMIFFLILALLEKNFSFSDGKRSRILLILYNVGLNITGLSLLVRGLTQVWNTALSRGIDASISGVSGIGHILLGISVIMLLLQIKKKV